MNMHLLRACGEPRHDRRTGLPCGWLRRRTVVTGGRCAFGFQCCELLLRSPFLHQPLLGEMSLVDGAFPFSLRFRLCLRSDH